MAGVSVEIKLKVTLSHLNFPAFNLLCFYVNVQPVKRFRGLFVVILSASFSGLQSEPQSQQCHMLLLYTVKIHKYCDPTQAKM